MNSSTPKGAARSMPDLFQNPVLRSYLSSVRDWHGYIRFLGLPDRRDNPDLIIDRLFVDPLLTRGHVSPDENPDKWIDEAETVTSALTTGKPLVLLGDPGAGKSTLVNYVVWLLARPGRNALVDRLGWRLPVPMVLRELRLRGVTDFGSLVEAFLGHAMSKPLREGEDLHEALAAGRAFIVLDGIDEIGDRSAREDLRRAVFEGFERYPRCSWMMTSRIVGYSEAPFDVDGSERRASAMFRDNKKADDEGPVITRFIAPFDDQRIVAFSRRWYVQRVAGTKRAEAEAADLVQAIHADEAILRLARVPNLLTMMALIHRVEATLPHGRALLYDRIAEAYLESIDKFRGIYSGAGDLPRKKVWLARIGYEMQRRRTPETSGQESDILVATNDVIRWLDDAMGRSGAASGVSSASEFLDYVGRRSGLFLPRGEDRYAFIHLSFQEYFAAVAIEREVTGIRWARDHQSPLGLEPRIVSEWGKRSAWRETMVFLFELLSTKEDWHADLMGCVFGDDFARTQCRSLEEEEALNLARLLARLVVNQQSGLAPSQKQVAISSCVRTQFLHRSGAWSQGSSDVLSGLLGEDDEWNARVIDVIVAEAKSLGVKGISLARTRIRDLAPLRSLDGLEGLDLMDTRVSDVSALTGTTGLRLLDLGGTLVADVGPLADLSLLGSLSLSRTKVSELGPLERMKSLRHLFLWATPVSDISPLEVLSELRSLYLMQTEVANIEALAGLVYLWHLGLSHSEISDIGPLSGLHALENLALAGTYVNDVRGLGNLRALRHLDLEGTRVSDLGPLAEISTMEHLDLANTPVRDIGALSRLTSLKWLDLAGTAVSDLMPLARIGSLEKVFVDGSVSDDEVGRLRELLPRCEVQVPPWGWVVGFEE